MHQHHQHDKRFMSHERLHDWMHENAIKAKDSSNNKDTATEDSDSVATVVSVVYVTKSASFTGPIAGYQTLGALTDSADTKAPATATATATAPIKATSTLDTDSSTAKAVSSATNKSTQAASLPTASHPSSQQSSQNTAASIISSVSSKQQTTLATSSTHTLAAGTPIQATRAATSETSSATPTAAPDTGMSGGAKAGLAFGILLGLALIAGAVLFALRRKRRQEEQGHQKLDDEKSPSPFGSAAAPRLSLRPVTQFMGMGETKVTEMTSATGGLGGFGPSSANRTSVVRPSTSSSDVRNPFGTNAETIDTAAAEKAAEKNAMNAPIPVPASDPFADKQGDARSVSPVEPESPRKAQIATAAAVAVPKPGAPGPQGANNVHRVQLDFKPSMEDELELIAGQVVRVLHHYDDGWALCMRMDRSKQGVAPRQCLSKLPIKPRPAGPPGAPQNGRPASPGMRNFSGPPPSGRPQQAGPRNPMFPAPLSPSMNSLNGSAAPRPNFEAQGRQRAHSHSQSAQGPQNAQTLRPAPTSPQSRRRSQSVGQAAGPNSPSAGSSPPRAGVPSRKPVPGMAM